MRGVCKPRFGSGAVALLLAALALPSCQEVEGPDTQVMLRIHSEDQALRAAMTSLQVRFALEEDAPVGWQNYPTREFAKGILHWPVDVPIVPSEPDDERKRFEVVIEALDGSKVLAQQRAVTGFVAGGLRLLEVWLYTCPGQDALLCLEPGCEHDRCRVCQLDGKCGSSVIARERLPAFDAEEVPMSRPPFDATGAPSGAMAPGGSSAGAGMPPSTGTMAGSATGGSLAGALGTPGGMGANDAGTLPPSALLDAGVGAGGGTSGGGATGGGRSDAGSAGVGGSTDAGGVPGATMPDAGMRDASAGPAGGTTGPTTGGTTGGPVGGSVAGGGVDAGIRDAGPQDAGLDSSVPPEAAVPEAGSVGGLFGGGVSEAGSTGGMLGGLFGGASGTTTAFEFDDSEFGPGSYSGW